jgi:hypothetical protein
VQKDQETWFLQKSLGYERFFYFNRLGGFLGQNGRKFPTGIGQA